MTEINNPKEFCNGSQSGTQQLQQDPCNCVPNIIAGPNIDVTPNEDGSVTISATVTDTDTRLGNPHTCAGAPAGYTRFCYDLINVISGATITADYTYVDIPDQDIQTLSIAGNNLSISNGNTIPLPTDTVTNTIAGNTIATHTAVDGTVEDINETVTTLTDNGDGTFTYTSEDGSTTTIDTNITNVLDSAGNVMTSTVNGVADTAPIINSNVLSVDVNGDLISTVNGVASTPLDLGSVLDIDDQQLSISGNTISLTNGGSVVLPSDIVTTVTNTVTGHLIGTYTNEAATAVNINETVTSIGTITLSSNVLTIPYIDENGVTNNKTIDLSSLAIDINVTSLTYNPVTGEIVLTETDGSTHTIDIGPFVETPVTVVDSALIDLTASGTSNHTITASIIPGTNGQVLTTTGGVAVWQTPTAAAQTPVTVVDTSTVDLTASGTDSHTVTADVKISSTAGNSLVVDGTGLFVPAIPTCEDIQDCVAPMMLGNGFTYDDVGNQWDTTGTNGQVLTANGTGGATWTTPTTGTTYTFNDTNTVDLTLTGSTVTADVRIDPSSCGVTTGIAGLRVDAKTISNTTSAIADQSAGITQTVTGCDRLLKLSLSTDTGQILKFGTDNKPLVRIDPTTTTLSATGGILIQNDADSDIEILKSPVCADAGTDVSTVVLGQKTSNSGNWGVTHAQDWLTVRTAAAAMTLVPATDSVISVDATAASRVVTLVAPVNCERRDFWIKRVDNVVANTVTINAQAGSTIEGVASITLSTTGAFGGNFGECAHIVWDSVNTRWLVI